MKCKEIIESLEQKYAPDFAENSASGKFRKHSTAKQF